MKNVFHYDYLCLTKLKAINKKAINKKLSSLLYLFVLLIIYWKMQSLIYSHILIARQLENNVCVHVI